MYQRLEEPLEEGDGSNANSEEEERDADHPVPLHLTPPSGLEAGRSLAMAGRDGGD